MGKGDSLIFVITILIKILFLSWFYYTAGIDNLQWIIFDVLD